MGKLYDQFNRARRGPGRYSGLFQPWSRTCTLCDAVITHDTAAEHYTTRHGTQLCGLDPSGISEQSAAEIEGFIRKLQGGHCDN